MIGSRTGFFEGALSLLHYPNEPPRHAAQSEQVTLLSANAWVSNGVQAIVCSTPLAYGHGAGGQKVNAMVGWLLLPTRALWV